MAAADILQSEPHTPKERSPSDAENDYRDAEKNYRPSDPKFWMIIISIYLSTSLIALDRMIIAAAIPSTTDERVLLTVAVFNPLFGRVYQLYHTKWVFLTSIVVFEVSSTLYGAAPSSTAFIVGRAVADIGAAGIFCGGIMIIVPLVTLRRRLIFTSSFGMAFGVSSVLGPLVGGSFTDSKYLTWRWCFYINLPIGGFTAAAILLFLHLESTPREKLSLMGQLKRLDP